MCLSVFVAISEPIVGIWMKKIIECMPENAEGHNSCSPDSSRSLYQGLGFRFTYTGHWALCSPSASRLAIRVLVGTVHLRP